MNMQGRRFTEKYENQVTEMKRAFLDFMKSKRIQIEEMANPENDSGSGPGRVKENPSLTITLTASGYPILPEAVNNNLSKAECETLLRGFLSQHYCQFIWSLGLGCDVSHSTLQILLQETYIVECHMASYKKKCKHSLNLNTGPPDSTSRIPETCTKTRFFWPFVIGMNDKQSREQSRPFGLVLLEAQTKGPCVQVIQLQQDPTQLRADHPGERRTRESKEPLVYRMGY